jgi:hypothetical protein
MSEDDGADVKETSKTLQHKAAERVGEEKSSETKKI